MGVGQGNKFNKAPFIVNSMTFSIKKKFALS